MAAPYFISNTDFGVRPYRIMNLEESTDFDDFMEAKEDEVCKALFGWETWDVIKAALDDSGTPDPEIQGLVDGEDYTYLEDDYHFYGMRQLLIPVIYSEWTKVSAWKRTNIGLGVNMKTDFTNVNPSYEISSTWNEFADKVGYSLSYKNTLWGYMKANEVYFDLWDEATITWYLSLIHI